MSEQRVLMKVEHLQKYFPIKKKSVFQREKFYVKANKDVSFEIYEGETLGLVGESGCGKSTLGRTMIQLYDQTGGDTLYYGYSLEEFYPAYLNRELAAIPKRMTNYKAEAEEFKTVEHLDTDEARHKRDAFKTKYDNIFRIAGALLLHPHLEKVSKTLTEYYRHAHALSKAEAQNKETAKLSEQVSQDLEALNVLHEAVKEHEDFEAYEAKRDTGLDLTSLTQEEMRGLRRDLQIIFQDPYSSLDPRLTVGQIIGEGLKAHKIFEKETGDAFNKYVIDIMEKCGLPASFIHRYPHQFSGGQRQRIGIARALALNPKFIVCDEAVSALDVSIQEQILKLLFKLKEENNLTYLFITHDLGVVRYMSDRIGVMYFGHLVELSPAEELFNNPQHPYTKALLAAIPKIQFEEAETPTEEAPIIDENLKFDFTYLETGEADKDWVEVTPGHFVACRLLNKEEFA